MPHAETARTRRHAAPPLGRAGSGGSHAGAAATIEDLNGEDLNVDQAAVDARDRTYRRLLIVADIVSLSLALIVCLTLLGDDQLRLESVLGLPLVVAMSKLHGLYDRDELLIRKTTMDEAPQLFHLATLYTLSFWLLQDVLVLGGLGSAQTVVLWGSLFAFSVVGRRTARLLALRTTEPEICLLVGDAESYERLRGKLDDTRINARLVGRMSPLRTGGNGGQMSDAHRLRELLGQHGVHRVIIEPHTLPPEEMLDFVRAAKKIGVRVSLLPRVLDVVGSSVVFDDLNGMTVLGVRRFGLTQSSRMVKRTFDVVGATVMLIAVAPVLAAVSIMIKLDSRGPVLFRQTRIGRDEEPFQICKFRTMCTDAEQRKDELRAFNEVDGGLFKIAADPRITRVGRFLRRTSLDELPQLFNVVAGDMSLVGPRPLVVDEDEQIKGFDRRRLQLTPGMTGPWQILGARRAPMPEMVKIDYLYVASWSLWQDMKIMVRTVPFVLARRGL